MQFTATMGALVILNLISLGGSSLGLRPSTNLRVLAPDDEGGICHGCDKKGTGLPEIDTLGGGLNVSATTTPKVKDGDCDDPVDTEDPCIETDCELNDEFKLRNNNSSGILRFTIEANGVDNTPGDPNDILYSGITVEVANWDVTAQPVPCKPEGGIVEVKVYDPNDITKNKTWTWTCTKCEDGRTYPVVVE